MHYFLLLIFFITFLGACTPTAHVVKTWDDNFSEITGYKGGIFKYYTIEKECPICQQRYVDGVAKAKFFCMDRPLILKSLGVHNEAVSVAVPTFHSSYLNGTVYSGGNTSNFSGSVFGFGVGSETVVDKYAYYMFLCDDTDMKLPVYIIANKEGTAPICKSIDSAIIPGIKRLENVAKLPDSDDCMKDGWIRFLTREKDVKVHAFIGENGKKLCKNLEDEMIQNQITNVNIYLRKKLVCK